MRSNKPLRAVPVFVLSVLAFQTNPAFAQQAGSTEFLVPMERYVVSPFLEDPLLLLQGAALPDETALSFSLGISYLKQPWRIFESQGAERQSPVEDRFAIRPSLSFSYRYWFGMAFVVPMAYQTSGSSPLFPSVQGQEGFHLLNPELHIKVPILHERISGLGLAGLVQAVFPWGDEAAFTNFPGMQGGVGLAVDWRGWGFGAALNTGVWLREKGSKIHDVEDRLHTKLGHELYIRPGVFYAFAAGGYELAVMCEANFATSLAGLFGSRNENAFQLLLSLQLQPSGSTGGFYAAVGSGARMQGGGYGVPLANLDARLGYSYHWGRSGEQPVQLAEARGKTAPERSTAGQPPGQEPEGTWQKPTAEARTEEPVADRAEEVGEEMAMLPERQPPAPRQSPQPPPELASIQSTQPYSAGQQPVGAGPGILATPALVTLKFASNQPAEEGGMVPSGSVQVPEAVRQQIRAKAEHIKSRLKEPGARLVIVGYADKCFEGPPPLADQYNLELSKRRARAMLKVLREELGDTLTGKDVTIVGMGRRCANSACSCSSPEMPECANDRRVDLFIDHGETRDFECPGGRYWLAR